MTPSQFEIKLMFKKYMRVKDPDKAHAVFSASGSERWLGCEGSTNLILKYDLKSEDNVFGIRGTNTHTLGEYLLKEGREGLELLKHPHAKRFKDFIEYDIDMHACASMYVGFIKVERARIIATYGITPKIYVEKKVLLPGVGFGTSDCIMVVPGILLHVIDYKNGTSIVHPEENTQGLYYSAAACELFGWDFKEVRISIIQPNATHSRGAERTWRTNTTRVRRAFKQLVQGVKAAKREDAPLKMDAKWCFFCPANKAGKCPLQNAAKTKKVNEKYFTKKKEATNGKEENGKEKTKNETKTKKKVQDWFSRN